MRFFKAVMALAASGVLATACSSGKPASSEPAISVGVERVVAQGKLLGGVAPNGAHLWRGVPYAASTAGENRWRAPRPAPSWEGVRKALTFSERCPQLTNGFNPVEGVETGTLVGSEDCLSLDIYAPADAAGRNLPVMVWIHGGSNVSGGADLYVGDRLAVNEDVIVVSVQYRLGPLGWFAHKALRDSAIEPGDAGANFGTLDLIASLRWVRDNIAAFGGDASNVTIFGESAGGHNVVTLLASPMASGLFHRAIIQSGSFDSTPLAEAEGSEGEVVGASNEVAKKLGGALEALQGASVEQVFDAFPLVDGFIELPRIIDDGVVLPSTPMRGAFSDVETFNTVPVMTGTNRDEMKLFYLLNNRLTKKVLGTFYVARDQDLYDAAAEYSSRMWRVRSVDLPAAAMRSAGHEDVYAYRFDWDEGGRFLFMDLSKMLGAAHAVEIPFVFNRFTLLGDADRILFQKKTLASREKLSRTMGAYWAAFARDGAPSVAGAPQWPIYGSASQAKLMRFDSESDGGVGLMSGADSIEEIIADLKADPRVDAAQRCEIAEGLGAWVPSMKQRFQASFCEKN